MEVIMKSAKTFLQILIISFFFTSCTLYENLEMQSDKYKVTYSINTTEHASMTKIKYTDINGKTAILTDFDLPWEIESIAESGQTIKLEVYGDVQESDISMQILAESGKNNITRDMTKEKSANKHYHYYITHTLE